MIVACASAHSAKLLGTCEKELHAIIDEILVEHFDAIIDFGAAEGYYAVGLARSSPSPCGIIAFEAQELGRQLLRELAARNSVKNLDIRGACNVMSLEEALASAHRKLIICDVKGFETELLDPDRVPSLLQCAILVELHGSPGTPFSDMIRLRFSHSHRIKEVLSVHRTWEDFPAENLFARLLPRYLAQRAMNRITKGDFGRGPRCRRASQAATIPPLRTPVGLLTNNRRPISRAGSVGAQDDPRLRVAFVFARKMRLMNAVWFAGVVYMFALLLVRTPCAKISYVSTLPFQLHPADGERDGVVVRRHAPNRSVSREIDHRERSYLRSSFTDTPDRCSRPGSCRSWPALLANCPRARYRTPTPPSGSAALDRRRRTSEVVKRTQDLQ
jgi:hypothetical protein